MYQFPDVSDRKQNPRKSENEKETLSHSAVATWMEKTYFSPAVGGENHLSY